MSKKCIILFFPPLLVILCHAGVGRVQDPRGNEEVLSLPYPSCGKAGRLQEANGAATKGKPGTVQARVSKG